jgi:competence protein ComEA
MLLAGLLALQTIRYARAPQYVPDPQPLNAPRYAELADKLDPNTADWRELAALPSLGEGRAREIVAWRERFLLENPGQVPFARPEDLLRVRGIGPAIVTTVRPYLAFPLPQHPPIPDDDPDEPPQDAPAPYIGMRSQD